MTNLIFFFSKRNLDCFLLQGLDQKSKRKVAIGTKLLNIAEFASSTDQKDFDLNIPLTLTGGSVESSPLLCVSLFPSIFLSSLSHAIVTIITIVAFKCCLCICYNGF